MQLLYAILYDIIRTQLYAINLIMIESHYYYPKRNSLYIFYTYVKFIEKRKRKQFFDNKTVLSSQ